MNKFYVGQRVQHVPLFGTWNKFEEKFPGLTHPVPYGIYAIREIYIELDESGKEQVTIRLKEIVNPARNFVTGYKEVGWLAAEFRPLDERKTDISIFQKMLTGNKVHENS